MPCRLKAVMLVEDAKPRSNGRSLANLQFFDATSFPTPDGTQRRDVGQTTFFSLSPLLGSKACGEEKSANFLQCRVWMAFESVVVANPSISRGKFAKKPSKFAIPLA